MSQTNPSKLRNTFLLEGYNVCKGSTSKFTKTYKIGEILGLNEENAWDIASYWNDSGCIEILDKDGNMRLTSLGIDKVEQELANEPILEDEEFTNEEIIELHRKIDEILNILERLGKGQEIIFDEIEGLKQKGKVLSKKDFQLLLIGKLIVYGINKTLDNSTVKEIYQTLVGGDINNLLR